MIIINAERRRTKMNRQEFQAAAPEIANPGAKRLSEARLALLGSLRKDGWPRISPIEPLFMAADLVLGMIWRSKKALDLLRDPRCVLHSVVTDPDANEGEFKLRAIANAADQQDYFRQIREGWRIGPSADLHVFTLDILSASLTIYDFAESKMLVKRWDPKTGMLETARSYP